MNSYNLRRILVISSDSISSFAAGLANVQVNLVVDPVLNGWTKTLRLINYVLALPKRLKHKLHLVPDQNCQICEVGDMKRDLTVLQEDVEKSLFRYETKVIKKITQDCVKCKIKMKKVSEVKMSTHNEARTVPEPPFHASMADITYGFKGKPFKGARKELKVYRFVIVCLLSEPCNILATEGPWMKLDKSSNLIALLARNL